VIALLFCVLPVECDVVVDVLCGTQLDMDWIHPWIGLEWIGSDDSNPVFFFHLYIFYINN